MELRSMFKVALVTAAGLVIGVGMQVESEATGYQYLCMAKPSTCQYAPSSAPQLNADVCYSASGLVVLKGAGSCATGTYPFYVDSGEVIDPVTGEVQAYIALADACSMGYCVVNDPNTPPGQEGPMCCDPSSGECTETDSICSPQKIAVWCDDGEDAFLQNGEWICEEAD
jgi:hypothetical protein